MSLSPGQKQFRRENKGPSAMTKVQAIFTLTNDIKNNRSSTTSAKRVVKACRVLGLTDNEIVQVMHGLSYCKSDGEPYGPHVEKVWPTPTAEVPS